MYAFIVSVYGHGPILECSAVNIYIYYIYMCIIYVYMYRFKEFKFKMNIYSTNALIAYVTLTLIYFHPNSGC